MPAPRKPTNILHLSGAFKKNPQRLAERALEPVPTGPIGDPPDWMEEYECAAWATFVAEAPPGVLTNADRGVLELACVLRALVKQRQADGKDRSLLKAIYAELGMTPSSRSKVKVSHEKEAPQNAFAAV